MMYNSKAFLLKRSKEIVKKKKKKKKNLSWKAAKKDEKDTLLNTEDRPSTCHFKPGLCLRHDLFLFWDFHLTWM